MNFNVGPCTQSVTYKDKAVSTGILQKIILASVVAGCVVLSCSFFYSDQDITSGDKYRGTPWTTDRTVSVKTLGETKFARCDVHTVRSEDGMSEVNDWIFMEEMDAVNVAVVTDEGKFVVFEQMKYGIPGKTLSPVGGFVDSGEAPWESARREVMEELGLGSRLTLQQMESAGGGMSAFAKSPKVERKLDEFGLAVGDVTGDSDWVYLGYYRTAANRGGGFIYTYLLKNAVPILPNGGTQKFQMTGDDEVQFIKFLSLQEAEESTRDGKFKEIKWAATFALSLLHLK